jgi:abortive infection bacteriophage resistance protein
MRQQYTKPALTFEDQVKLLQSRGMVVSDPKHAIGILSRISYYRLSGYWLPFKKPDDTFAPGTTFEKAVELYEYDRRLRLAVLDAIERVEVLMRTVVTYELAHAFGAFAHCHASNFADAGKHADWLQKHEEEIERARERFLDHFKQKYIGFPQVPIWMAAEVISLGALSRMFQNLHAPQQGAIAKHWGVHRSVVESWMHTLTVIRNICAHHSSLWNRSLRVKPKLPQHDAAWALLRPDRVYTILCILRQLTMPHHGGDDWADIVRSLLTEMDPHPAFRSSMGTSANWATSSFWT